MMMMMMMYLKKNFQQHLRPPSGGFCGYLRFYLMLASLFSISIAANVERSLPERGFIPSVCSVYHCINRNNRLHPLWRKITWNERKRETSSVRYSNGWAFRLSSYSSPLRPKHKTHGTISLSLSLSKSFQLVQVFIERKRDRKNKHVEH